MECLYVKIVVSLELTVRGGRKNELFEFVVDGARLMVEVRADFRFECYEQVHPGEKGT